MTSKKIKKMSSIPDDANMETVDFRKIEFGDADAINEVSDAPDLLVDGFFDPMEMVESALCRRQFLFLGSKGSGKSALSGHIKLLSERDHNMEVLSIMLNEFPYKIFSKVIKGQEELESKYQIAWRFILLLYAFSSFDTDHNCTHTKADEWTTISNYLHKKGLFPIVDVSDIVRKTSKNSFSIDLKLLKYHSESLEQEICDINSFSNYLKQIIGSVNTNKRYYLIIDGLDQTMTNREEQFKSIMALINQSNEINNWCRKSSIPFKIIVLCRTDIFDRLNDPNKNKLKNDFAFTIRWFDESETDDDKRSALVKLANIRGRLTYPQIGDIFDKFLPDTYENKAIRKALLDFTRHTPRDFIQLLKMIQKSCSGLNVTSADITSGIKKYSQDYFRGEIEDELAGYLSSEEIDLTFQLLSQFKQRDFKFSEIQQQCASNPSYAKIDWMNVFSLLFNCSAVGNRKGEKNLLFMKYRNPHAVFNRENVIMIHRGLWKALS